MTRTEVESIRDLNNVLRRLRQEQEMLENSIGVSSPELSGMPRGNAIGRPTESLAIRLADKLQEIRRQELALADLRLRILEFIDSLSDEMIKQIIFYRFCRNLSWNKTAARIGYGDPSTYRKMYERFWEEREHVYY